MGNVFINLQTKDEPEPTGAVMLALSDSEAVQIGYLPDMLYELIEQHISGWDTKDRCIDRRSMEMLTPLLGLFAAFTSSVVELREACTPEFQAKLDAEGK